MTDIKTWQERIEGDMRTFAVDAAKEAEIAELRAALAASCAVAPAHTDEDWRKALQHEVMLANVFAYWTVTRDQLISLLGLSFAKQAAPIPVFELYETQGWDYTEYIDTDWVQMLQPGTKLYYLGDE